MCRVVGNVWWSEKCAVLWEMCGGVRNVLCC
ncbi:hypothetical protein AVEN_22568-1, partial [Araneus ventricosus]